MQGPPRLRFERLDAGFDALLPRDAEAELIVELADVPGPHWLEGPAWDRRQGCLLFSDTKGNAIHRWSRSDGCGVFLKPSGYAGPEPAPMEEPGANGLAFDRQGRLVMCEHGDRRVTRLEADGRRSVLADAWQGRRLNSPNDVVCRRNGELWFTDPPYGLPRRFEDPGKELPFNGVFRIGEGGGLELVLKDVSVPNGIGFSPDESALYVTEGAPGRKGWLAFDLRPDGSLGGRRWLFDGSGLDGSGSPDGLCVDAGGHVFATGFERVLVLTPEGRHLGSIRPGSRVSNVAWGEDGSVLFITADTRVWRLPTATRGAGW